LALISREPLCWPSLTLRVLLLPLDQHPFFHHLSPRKVVESKSDLPIFLEEIGISLSHLCVFLEEIG